MCVCVGGGGCMRVDGSVHEYVECVCMSIY